MATPMSPAQIVAQLKKWGVPFKEYKSWRTHNRNHKGAWGPVNGFMVHHTGSDSKDQRAMLYNGLANLPGPLSQFGLAQDGTVHLIGWGRANHAGAGDPDVLNAVIAESYGKFPPKHNESRVDGNSRFYGVEIWYSGSHSMTSAQYASLRKLAAAVLDFHKWGEKSVIGHGEWGSPGKWDPGYAPGKMMDMSAVRADIKSTLNGKPGAPAPKPSGKTHTVAKGDTLWSIGQKYKVSVASLRDWNGLKSDTLSIGQKLSVVAPAAKPREMKWLRVPGYVPELRHGDENWHVGWLQRNLNRFYDPNLKVTGKYDDATAKVVDKFYAEKLNYKTTTSGKVFGADGWRRVLSIAKNDRGTS